jgi:hypothetical protein
MANLYFPQLMSGALVQYPIRKTLLTRSIKNILPDGNMILLADPDAARLIWQLSYADLSSADIRALQAHFNACVGPFHAFTFIDPTDNMLASSSDWTAAAWQQSGLIKVVPGIADPAGGSAAFRVTNTSAANQEISQVLAVPASYQYCFSIYASSAYSSTLNLVRSGPSSSQVTNFVVGPTWTRLISAGRLNDPGVNLTVAVSLSPGQEIQIYAVQLEPQNAPSRYKPTTNSGGVYAGAHWTADELTITAQAPDLFSASFSIETALED